MQNSAAIVERLQELYKPIAVVLHGSRAAGHQRQHSDWDLFLLFPDEREQSVGREEIAGSDVEWHALKVPVAERDFLRHCGVQLQFAHVLWEDDSHAGSTLVNQAKAFYAKGLSLTGAQKATYKQYLIHKANGMADDVDTPYLFLRHLHIFFERASNWWFEMHGEYRKPLYVAVPTIQQRDPEYGRLLTDLAGPGPNSAKVLTARRLTNKLFAQ